MHRKASISLYLRRKIHPIRSTQNIEVHLNKFCNPARPLQESPGPSGPGIPKESQKSLPGLPAPGSKKCPKQSRNSLRSLKTVYFETPETVSRLFRTLFGPRGRKAPGDSFETLSGFRARRARETPVRGGRGSSEQVYLIKNIRSVPDSRHRENGKSARELVEKLRLNAFLFFGVSGFGVDFRAPTENASKCLIPKSPRMKIIVHRDRAFLQAQRFLGVWMFFLFWCSACFFPRNQHLRPQTGTHLCKTWH